MMEATQHHAETRDPPKKAIPLRLPTQNVKILFLVRTLLGSWPLIFLWSVSVVFRRVALETSEWTSRDSNHRGGPHMRSLISLDFPAPEMEPESAHVVSAVSVP